MIGVVAKNMHVLYLPSRTDTSDSHEMQIKPCWDQLKRFIMPLYVNVVELAAVVTPELQSLQSGMLTFKRVKPLSCMVRPLLASSKGSDEIQ